MFPIRLRGIMKRKSIEKFNWRIISVLVLYAFITATHIILLPFHSELNPSNSTTQNSIYNTRQVAAPIPVLLQLRRIDKCTLDEKSSSLSIVFFALTISFLFLISFFDALKKRKMLFAWDTYSFHNKQYAYLTLCTFRI